MQIKERAKPGLIIWGTKRGKSVFISSNLLDNEEELNRQLNDIQSNISFQRISHEFFCFEFRPAFKLISIIHSINDALGRIGYLAISLVIPPGMTVSTGSTRLLLKQMMQLYMDRYVLSDYAKKTINLGAREDIALFEQVLINSGIKLRTEDFVTDSPAAESKGSCYLKFTSDDELDRLLENYEREDLARFERVFILPYAVNDLTANVNFTELPPPVRKIRGKVRLLDDEGVLYDVKVEVEGTKCGKKQLTSENADFIFYEDEQLTISANKSGYDPFSRQFTNLSNYINEGTASFTLTLKRTKPAGKDNRMVDFGGFNNPAGPTTNPKKKESIFQSKIFLILVAVLVVAAVFWGISKLIGGGGQSPGGGTTVVDNTEADFRNKWNAEFEKYKTDTLKEIPILSQGDFIRNLQNEYDSIRRNDSIKGLSVRNNLKSFCESLVNKVRLLPKPNPRLKPPTPAPPDPKTDPAKVVVKPDNEPDASFAMYKNKIRNAGSVDKLNDIKGQLKDWWESKKELYKNRESEYKQVLNSIQPAIENLNQGKSNSQPEKDLLKFETLNRTNQQEAIRFYRSLQNRQSKKLIRDRYPNVVEVI